MSLDWCFVLSPPSWLMQKCRKLEGWLFCSLDSGCYSSTVPASRMRHKWHETLGRFGVDLGLDEGEKSGLREGHSGKSRRRLQVPLKWCLPALLSLVHIPSEQLRAASPQVPLAREVSLQLHLLTGFLSVCYGDTLFGFLKGP